MRVLPRASDGLPSSSCSKTDQSRAGASLHDSPSPVHHTKHHQTYVNGLNAAEESYQKALADSNTLQLIKLQSALKFNGGGPLHHCPFPPCCSSGTDRAVLASGHINHDTFWKNLAPYGSSATKLRDGPLKKAIDEAFGSLDGASSPAQSSAFARQASLADFGLRPLARNRSQDQV